jgi:hypothetical protein
MFHTSVLLPGYRLSNVSLEIQQKNLGKIEGQLHNFLFSVFCNGVLVIIRHVLHLRNLEKQPAIVISFAFLISKREQMPAFPKNKKKRPAGFTPRAVTHNL